MHPLQATPYPYSGTPFNKISASVLRTIRTVVAFLVVSVLLFASLRNSSLALAQDLTPDQSQGIGSNFSAAALSEAELARHLPVTRVEVSGNRRIVAEDIAAYIKFDGQEGFTPEALSINAKELWQTGFFDDVQIDLQKRDNSVVLRIIVRERPNVLTVSFEGNDEISSDDLKEKLETKEGSILNHQTIQRSIQKIRDAYAEKGYFLAEATSEVIPLKNNEVEVKFKVTEHNEVTVRRVSFIGNRDISSSELIASMITGNPGILSFGSGGTFRQDAFERDMAVISAMYYDRGYLQVSVHSPRIMLTPDRTGIEISVTIDEGPRFKIRQLRVYERGPDGREVEPIGGRKALQAKLPLESGDYFNRAALMEGIQAIARSYRDEGYANVVTNPETNVDAETLEVDITVPIVRNQLVTIERIEIRGNTKTRDKVIRRELELIEGHHFSQSALERSKMRVTALGFFERVDFTQEAGTSPDKMRIYVEVGERQTGTFQIGAGFSTIESVIITAQIQQTNLFGNGQQLSLNGQISGIRQQLTLQFYEPYFLDTPVRFSADLYNQLRYYVDFSQTRFGGSVTWGYPIIQPELAASFTYTLENNEVSTASSPSLFANQRTSSVFRRLPLANLFQDGIISSIRPSIVWDSRNDRQFPTSGLYFSGSTEIAPKALGSENEFVKTRLTGRYYVPIGNFGAVLKLNQEFGIITSPSAKGVPIYQRFFLGGILDVRGFVFRTLGPRMPLSRTLDPNSQPIPGGAAIGGNMMYYQNLEFEFPIVKSVGVRGVFFTDLGNAWNLEAIYCQTGSGIVEPSRNPCFDMSDFFSTLRASYGAGLRWFSPLGPLRFELGLPFSPLYDEQSSRFEFTIGNFF